MRSSDRALQFIEDEEIGSPANYPHAGLHPYWPGGESGPTWGIGFDAGYETHEQIRTTWGLLLDGADVDRLAAAAGIRGAAAKAAITAIADIAIPLAAARAAFRDLDAPRYEAMVVAAFPTAAELPGDAFGALTSLVYNRGASCTDDPQDPQHRRREMRQIQQCANSRWWNAVPDLIRAMKRLWENVGEGGLLRRRDAEADLFIAGLEAWAAPPFGAIWPPPAQPRPGVSPPAPAPAVSVESGASVESPPTADDLNAAELANLGTTAG